LSLFHCVETYKMLSSLASQAVSNSTNAFSWKQILHDWSECELFSHTRWDDSWLPYFCLMGYKSFVSFREQDKLLSPSFIKRYWFCVWYCWVTSLRVFVV